MEDMNIVNPIVDEKDYILEVDGLKQYFPVAKDFFGRPLAYLRAVDGVSFKLERGKTLGVVGESGCGITTLGRTILRLYDVTEGSALYTTVNELGEKVSYDLAKISKKALVPPKCNVSLKSESNFRSSSPTIISSLAVPSKTSSNLSSSGLVSGSTSGCSSSTGGTSSAYSPKLILLAIVVGIIIISFIMIND